MEPGKKPRPGTERTEGGNISTQRDSRRKRKRLPVYWPPLTWPPGQISQGSTQSGELGVPCLPNPLGGQPKGRHHHTDSPQDVAPSIEFCIGGECTGLRRRLTHACAAAGQTRA